MNKPDDSSQRLNVTVLPDAQVLRTNPALGKNRRGFGKHQSSTAHCPAAEMYKMPVVHVPVSAGVLAHRRNKYTVRKRNIPNRERIKQVSHGVVDCPSLNVLDSGSGTEHESSPVSLM
jgi:hypothetical protein